MYVPRWAIVATAALALTIGAVGLVSGASHPTTSSPDLTSVAAASAAPSATDRSALRGIKNLRSKLGRRVVHAVVTLQRPASGLITVQVDHGTLSGLGSGTLSVGEAGGTTITVSTTTDTRVRRDGKKVDLSVLKAGDQVFVLSVIPDGGGQPVAAIVFAPTKAATSAPSASPGSSG